MSTNILGVILALISAVLYGTGDFSGGLASRRAHPFQVLLLSSSSSILLAIVLFFFKPEGLMSARDLFFSAIAGFMGAAGLILLFRGLCSGSAAVVAPTSGVVSAALPALAGIFLDGFPRILTLSGFILAFFGIWLVTRSKDDRNGNIKKGLLLGTLAGTGFGGYYVLIVQVSENNLILPLLVVKIAAFILAFALLSFNRYKLPSVMGNGQALLSGIFDFSANGFYMVATYLTRMDVAAVLSSLFPAATVFLSMTILKEKISGSQWLGVIFCIAAIAMIVW